MCAMRLCQGVPRHLAHLDLSLLVNFSPTLAGNRLGVLTNINARSCQVSTAAARLGVIDNGHGHAISTQNLPTGLADQVVPNAHDDTVERPIRSTAKETGTGAMFRTVIEKIWPVCRVENLGR